MTNQENEPEIADNMHTLMDSSKSTSEAFSIIAAELIEVKAMLMALIDLQKSALFATGVSETELESNVQSLIEGYRSRYLSGLTNRVREALDQQ